MPGQTRRPFIEGVDFFSENWMQNRYWRDQERCAGRPARI